MPILSSFYQATRPRTYPLAVSSILCGTGLAISQLINTGQPITPLNWLIFALTLWVALALQILSNLANDYGDGIKGTDTLRDKTSPTRITANAKLDPNQFKRLIYLWAFFTFWSGVALISIGFNSLRDFLLFLAFGIIAIIAAMAYTMGKRPYGYRAMGEVAVILFFGWLGVLGSIYLQTHHLNISQLLPATGCGGLSACVLYINNMRDKTTDKQAGKTTIAIMLGDANMLKGYYLLLALSLVCYLIYAKHNPYTLLWLLALPLILKHLKALKANQTNLIGIGIQLKTIVLICLIINILFITGLAISHAL